MSGRNRKRRIAVVTGSRAEYGLLRSVLEAIDADKRLELQLIVTGMHLLKRFGVTVREIESDGWNIVGKVRLQDDSDNAIEQAKGMGRAISAISGILGGFGSDIVLVLGDRIEAFAAAAAATASGVVLAHIHGGEVAEGVRDDAYRHAISKLAHLHFVTTKGAKQRLERMGEAKNRIYRTGSPGLDGIKELICKDYELLSNLAGFDISEDFALVVQHPAGGTAAQEEKRMRQTLAGISGNCLKCIALYPNSDSGFSGIVRAAQQVCSRRGWSLVKSVPREIYLGWLKRCRVLVGNSSSGIIEAGYLNVDVVNVGLRQSGRERGANVLDVPYGSKSVSAGVATVLGRQRTGRRGNRIYGDGKSSSRIVGVLAEVTLDERLRQKRIVY